MVPIRPTTSTSLAIVLFAALLVVGLALWLPDAGSSHGTANSELGSAILGGGIVALVVFSSEKETRRQEARRTIAQALINKVTTAEFSGEMARTLQFLADDPATTASRWSQLSNNEMMEFVAL